MNSYFPPIASVLGGETLTIEYKQDLDSKNKQGPLSVDVLASSLMALGNAQGGYLLLGVNDAGHVLGIHVGRTTLASLRDAVIRKFATPPQIASHTYKEAGKTVWAFHIEPATQNPLQLNDSTIRIRRLTGKKQGPENLPLLANEIPSWQAECGTHHDFSSALIPDLTWKNQQHWLNPIAIERFEMRLRSGRINNGILRTLPHHEARFEALGRLVSSRGEKMATNAALILFGRNEILRERLSAHDTQFQKFDASGALPINLFLGQEGLEQRCLLLLAERLEELFRGNVARRELMDGLFRVDVPDYGDDALREATMNAFIHRDYLISESVVIQLHPQRFTISNPGGFFRDVTPENILFHEPCPRNKLLAQACADLGLVEKSGRGVDRIFLDQIRYFRPLPSYAGSNEAAVRLHLEGGETSLEAVRWMLEHFQDTNDMNVRLVHGAFLHHIFFDGETTREDLMRVLPGLPEDRARRAVTELISAGLVAKIGHGRGQRLVLSSQLQKELGCPEAFIHQVGMGDEQRRQMILSFVDAHGKITRSQAAHLLNLPPGDKVYSLLQDLTGKDELVMRGKLRYAFYERAIKAEPH